MTDFLCQKDPLVDLKEELYKRLAEVKRSQAVKPDLDDEFEMGIDCRLSNEEWWLTDLLDKIERS